ncbi:MAG: sialidase family protein [Acidobacteriota bacterium]
MFHPTRTLGLLAAMVGVSAGVVNLGLTTTAAVATRAIEAVPLASPAGPNSAQPQLSVSDRGVLLSWIERRGPTATLRFSELASSGWSAPRDIASGDDWFVNWADVPSVIRLDNGHLAAHWLQKSGSDTYAYDVRLSYSTDDGRTWAPSFTPHHDGTRTEHGFASLFQMPGGGLGLVWLDGRAMQASHDGHGKGAMTVRFATFDTAWKQTSEMPIDLRVCECCPTAAAVTADGPIAAYRDRSDAEVRDIYVSRFENGRWTPGAPVHADNWVIPACPVNGPALSARGRDVVLAWFTAKGDQGQAYLAFSKDAGRSFGAPIRVDDAGTLGRVDVDLLPDGSAVATWIEFADQRAQFRTRRITSSGERGEASLVAGIAGSRSSGYPRLARRGDTFVFAWTESGEGGALQVRTATAAVPGTTSR